MEEEFKKLELEKKWDAHFELLFTKSRKHSVEIGESAKNKTLNRYLNVLPYDRSRVKLNRTIDSDYINANLVTVPKAARQYILTQGPLPETLSHFWLMVWEQKSTVIVMLNKCVEAENFVKCEQYWPETLDSKMRMPDVKLTVTLIKVDETKHFSIRTMLLEDDESHKTRTISQFQYKAWPDHDQPDSPTSFLRLLTAIRKSGGLDKMDEPTIVHCSAGIGRSGTFCLIDSVLSMVENQGSTEGIDIANTLLEMRDYRMGLIQSPVQLRFAYMSIIYGIKILEKANKLHHHMSSINAIDNSSLQKINGSSTAQYNGKSKRRTRKKPSGANNASALNVFNKHLLVEAMDDIDSDTADRLFDDAMIHLPSLKKARNSEPENFNEDLFRQVIQITKDNQRNDTTEETNQAASPATKAQMLTNAINSLIPGSTISQDVDPSPTNQSADSVLLRRRERELRNQRLAEKTLDIKNRMKAEEVKKALYASRMAFFKKSALFGGVAIVISSIAYMYLHGS
uniref:protein-tyrosine-phosphatase n=1 Tax=Aceria tosichella TaxID=561515 RepID=A0A6G1S974_9ACAR